jgi:hypothetical protein
MTTLFDILGPRIAALGGLASTPAGQNIAARADMTELVQIQREGRSRGEESARFGPS